VTVKALPPKSPSADSRRATVGRHIHRQAADDSFWAISNLALKGQTMPKNSYLLRTRLNLVPGISLWGQASSEGRSGATFEAVAEDDDGTAGQG